MRLDSSIFSDGKPMTEAEFVTIGETPERVELFDGSLHVTPAGAPLHQMISRQLANSMDAGDLLVLAAVNVRLGPRRIAIPDLVVSSPGIDIEELVIDAAAIRLVCEIISPSNAATDRVLKMHYYASGGIPWYLLVDPQARTLQLYRLVSGTYVEEATVKDGDVLRLTEPIAATIDPEKLFPPV